MKLVDLTMTLGDPAFAKSPQLGGIVYEKIHDHETHGKSNTKIIAPVHAGTHADSPYHSLPDGQSIDEMPLDKFIGPAVLVDVRQHIQPKTALTLEQLKSSVPAGISLADKIVCLHSGWLKDKYGTTEFYTHYPYVSPEAIDWLIEQRVKLVALDFTVDFEAAKVGGFDNHRRLGRAGIPMIERVYNLDLMPTEFQFIGFPAKYLHCDGSPVRAVAILPDDAAPSQQAGQLDAAAGADLPSGYDPEAFAFFSKYWTEKGSRQLFDFIRSNDEDYFRVWQDFVVNGMYRRNVIDFKIRELCAVASFVAVNSLPHVRAHVTAALAAGATPEEIKEVILQQSVFAGMPRVMPALVMFREALEAFKQGGGYVALQSLRPS